ncbi:ribosome maturation factor RimP [uncultured Campylobacter sp.]|uniref:ribosome maturation factor RimP n=1 Tax=uncultured Campylobacter sp. TaxID=218934 RepID=UPI002617FE0C|nr:ribosome maturation factor RimP [uncultured Campylobacter sp.]
MNLEALCAEVGLDFYDDELVNENGRKIYRVYVSKQGGVSLDDCAKLSEILSPILDIESPVSTEYSLEVSSTGLERKLSKLKHFEKSIGELVSISTISKEKFQGKLVSVKDGLLTLQNGEGKIELNFNDIKKAKTFVIWD